MYFDINIKMTQYNTVNVKPSAEQLNRLKSATKNANDGTLRLSSNMIFLIDYY